VAGYIENGIYIYKGIPYAEAERFMPPTKVTKWDGVRSSRSYGPTSPQGKRMGWYSDEQAFAFDWNDGYQDEDCLRLNIWTPGINGNQKRPVMVWLHGGGYSAGSGHELPSYDGTNLSRKGDIVVVSLNHRLNVLGFLDLSAYGEKYKESGNVGILDIVAALEWINKNISSFGGDPSNVTIFGQSGGGGKVSTLLATPSAEGLFHKAIIQSGAMLNTMESKWSRRIGTAVARELGLNSSDIDKIQNIPYQQLLEAGEKAVAEVKVEADKEGFKTFIFGWAPTIDGNILPSKLFYPTPPEQSKNIPILVGTTLHEFCTSTYNPSIRNITQEQAIENDNSVWRVTKQVAQTMLGKALLWQNKYSEAAKVFNEVRNSGKYKLYEGEYQNILTYIAEGNSESMLESNRILDLNNPMDEFSFYEVMNHWRMDNLAASSAQFYDYKETGWGFMVPQKKLYDAFVAEEGVDGYRLNHTMKTYEQMNELGVKLQKGKSIINEGVFLWKRRFSSSEAPITFWCSYNNYRWMRYAEVLLLAAEANFMAGNQSEADAALNEVRSRARLPFKPATLEAIKLEKRLELCSEYTRYQDIIRWGDAEALLKNQGATTPLLINKSSSQNEPDNVVVEYVQYNTDPSRYGFKPKHYLLPIPATEMRLNPNMVQNEGW
jgi:carboxylesterase type B